MLAGTTSDPVNGTGPPPRRTWNHRGSSGTAPNIPASASSTAAGAASMTGRAAGCSCSTGCGVRDDHQVKTASATAAAGTAFSGPVDPGAPSSVSA